MTLMAGPSFIRGPGLYSIYVKDTALFPDSFIALCGVNRRQYVKIKISALLSLHDNDENKVLVSIKSYPLGYLSREHARAFRRIVRYGELSKYEKFECAAILQGGWDKESGEAKDYAARLDLPLDD